MPLNFVFPKNLQPQGDPGAYIVQARGPIDQSFRAMLAQAGATIIAYIPNDAYLVRASASVAGVLGANPQTQAVIPYEPYYKIQSSLLYQAQAAPCPMALSLKLVCLPTMRRRRFGKLKSSADRSRAGPIPFGPIVRCNCLPPRGELDGSGRVDRRPDRGTLSHGAPWRMTWRARRWAWPPTADADELSEPDRLEHHCGSERHRH